MLPETHDYFSKEPDLRVQPIVKTMTRDRFYSIQRALHFANNDEAPDRKDPVHDRALKIRPLIKHFNAAFQNAMRPTFRPVFTNLAQFDPRSTIKPGSIERGLIAAQNRYSPTRAGLRPI